MHTARHVRFFEPHSQPSMQARRNVLGLGVAMALGLPGCGGGGSDSASSTPISAPAPTPMTNGIPAGAFGAGRSRIAMMRAPGDAILLDLATRQVTTRITLGLDSSVFGFTASSAGTLALMARRGFAFEASLRVCNADATVTSQFNVALGTGTPRSAAALSRDGARLAFGVNVAETGATGTFWYVCVANADGSNQRFVPVGRKVGDLTLERANPAWLADGRLLVQTDQAIYVSDDASVVKLTQLRVLPTGAPNRTVMDRTGNRVLFDQKPTGGGQHVWSYDLAAGQLQQLTSGNFEQYMGAVSPDGTWLMFLDNRAILVSGVPSASRADYVCAIPLRDQVTDLTGQDVTLRDAAGQLLSGDSGLVGWI
jgi:WD40-like Beta Propeller Repeat